MVMMRLVIRRRQLVLPVPKRHVQIYRMRAACYMRAACVVRAASAQPARSLCAACAQPARSQYRLRGAQPVLPDLSR